MTEDDANAVYNAGWSETALFDAIQVCAVFNLVNRLVEGTGISKQSSDPTDIDDETLAKFSEQIILHGFRQSQWT